MVGEMRERSWLCAVRLCWQGRDSNSRLDTGHWTLETGHWTLETEEEKKEKTDDDVID